MQYTVIDVITGHYIREITDDYWSVGITVSKEPYLYTRDIEHAKRIKHSAECAARRLGSDSVFDIVTVFI